MDWSIYSLQTWLNILFSPYYFSVTFGNPHSFHILAAFNHSLHIQSNKWMNKWMPVPSAPKKPINIKESERSDTQGVQLPSLRSWKHWAREENGGACSHGSGSVVWPWLQCPTTAPYQKHRDMSGIHSTQIPVEERQLSGLLVLNFLKPWQLCEEKKNCLF